MLARYLVIVFLMTPIVLNAKQEATEELDIELFEFLAMYDEQDTFFIDEEIEKKEKLSSNDAVDKSDSDEK